MTHLVDEKGIFDFLKNAIYRQSSPQALDWLTSKLQENNAFFPSFSSVPRYFSRTPLQFTDEEIKQAESLHKNWTPHNWTLEQAARTLLLLFAARQHTQDFKKLLEKLLHAADFYEQITIYQCLSLLPQSEQLLPLALNGTRSNMSAVFNAIALNNPYPQIYFSQSSWNQLVLKTFFIGSPLHFIVGLTKRANPLLAQMLINYADERMAAKRIVLPELWYLVGQGMNENTFNFLTTKLNEANIALRQGIALSFHYCTLSKTKEIPSFKPEIFNSIKPMIDNLNSKFSSVAYS